MMLAKVTGTVVASVRSDRIDSPVYLLVTPWSRKNEAAGSEMIALDIIGAGQGEMVLVSQGSSVRQTPSTVDKAVDALVIGIVDSVSEAKKEVYRK